MFQLTVSVAPGQVGGVSPSRSSRRKKEEGGGRRERERERGGLGHAASTGAATGVSSGRCYRRTAQSAPSRGALRMCSWRSPVASLCLTLLISGCLRNGPCFLCAPLLPSTRRPLHRNSSCLPCISYRPFGNRNWAPYVMAISCAPFHRSDPRGFHLSQSLNTFAFGFVSITKFIKTPESK